MDCGADILRAFRRHAAACAEEGISGERVWKIFLRRRQRRHQGSAGAGTVPCGNGAVRPDRIRDAGLGGNGHTAASDFYPDGGSVGETLRVCGMQSGRQRRKNVRSTQIASGRDRRCADPVARRAETKTAAGERKGGRRVLQEANWYCEIGNIKNNYQFRQLHNYNGTYSLN